jgi:IS30 family transposase
MNARTIDDATWQFVQDKLLEEWSPEQISHFAAISPETVYQRIYADKRAGGMLWKHLRCQKQRKKRYGKTDRRGIIPNRQSIEQRPAIVETRSRIGDWEVDTLIGKNHRQAIVSIVERKTGFTLIRKVERKTAKAVSDAMIKLLKPYCANVHTITSDNGREFAGHEAISKKLKADSTSLTPTHPGSAAPTRIPMDYSGSTSRKIGTSPPSHNRRSTPPWNN